MSNKQPFFSVDGVTQSNRILHTPSIMARKNLIYVQEVGKLKSLIPHICRREKLSSFLIMYVLNGRGYVRTQEQEYTVHAGDCVFLNCMQAYEHLSSEEEPWELLWVHFYGNNAEMYFNLFHEKNAGAPLFRPSGDSPIKDYIQKIMSLKDEKDLLSEFKAAYYLTGLLTECLDVVMDEEQLGDMREFVNENFKETEIIHLLTEKYHKTEEELNELFIKNYGIELRDYILVRRFTCAKELLRFTIKDIPVVIEESGIRNEDLFRQLFRENEGMTAEEYRMKWAQWIKA